jgi:predicted SnoaL-like aldol condensation-catalyzing enzyme
MPPTYRREELSVSLEKNKQTVVAYLEQALNAKQPAEAVAAYVGPRYIQHNPQAADGPEAFIAFVKSFAQQFPDLHIDIKRVIAEGDLVVTHSLLTAAPGDRGTAVADIFRVEDGKIVEHWDVLQPVPETAANDNTMF